MIFEMQFYITAHFPMFFLSVFGYLYLDKMNLRKSQYVLILKQQIFATVSFYEWCGALACGNQWESIRLRTTFKARSAGTKHSILFYYTFICSWKSWVSPVILSCCHCTLVPILKQNLFLIAHQDSFHDLEWSWVNDVYIIIHDKKNLSKLFFYFYKCCLHFIIFTKLLCGNHLIYSYPD